MSAGDLERWWDFRVRPAFGKPVDYVAGRGEYQVFDIGVDGLSLRLRQGDQPVAAGETLAGSLRLPGVERLAPAALKVLTQEGGGLLRCRYEGIAEAEQRAIADYVRGRAEQIASFLGADLRAFING